MLRARNQLLFTWKNVTDAGMLLEHSRALIIYLIKAPRSFRWGFYEAIKKIAEVLRRRKVSHQGDRYTDREVVALSTNKPVNGCI